MARINQLINRAVNYFRPDNQVKLVRGRWCSVKKIRPTVYRVSVIDTWGNYVGARFITPRFGFDREIDRAVHSVLVTCTTF